MDNIKVGEGSRIPIESLSYKALYEDNLFKFGFAKNDANKSLNIKAEFDLTEDAFKSYLLSIFKLVIEFKVDTNRDLFKEILEEIPKKQG